MLLADFAISKTPTNILAVTHVTVIDATGAAALPERTILITDDLITGIGRSEDINLPTNATVLNAASGINVLLFALLFGAFHPVVGRGGWAA